ncbi:MAG: DUF1643 domain-containing protein [Thiotrichaceae bacterium]|nr:DUF1643 domain-containing protein [Thiotrichaceae bacterium]
MRPFGWPFFIDVMNKGAILSRDRKFRYVLWREWDTRKGTCVFIGLNPSTADENEDDPTLRRCVNFAKDWGFGKCVMINLFAFRATDPGELKNQDKPVGYKNNHHIAMQSAQAELVVAAWGIQGSFLKRDKKVLKLLNDVPLKCFKLTSKGQPAHPLYQPKDNSLIDYG